MSSGDNLARIIQQERRKQEEIRKQVEDIARMKREKQQQETSNRKKQLKMKAQEYKMNVDIAKNSVDSAIEAANQQLLNVKKEFELQEVGKKPDEFFESADIFRKYAGMCCYCPVNYPNIRKQSATAESLGPFFSVKSKEEFEEKYVKLQERLKKISSIGPLNCGMDILENKTCCVLLGGLTYLMIPPLACYHCIVGNEDRCYREKTRTHVIIQVYEKYLKRMDQPPMDEQRMVESAQRQNRYNNLVLLKERKEAECKQTILNNEKAIQIMNVRLETVRLQFVKEEEMGQDISYLVAMDKRTTCCLTTNSQSHQNVKFSVQYLAKYFHIKNTKDFHDKLRELYMLNDALGSCQCECCINLSQFVTERSLAREHGCGDSLYLMGCFPWMSLPCLPFLCTYRFCEWSCNGCYQRGKRVETLINFYQDFVEEVGEVYF